VRVYLQKIYKFFFLSKLISFFVLKYDLERNRMQMEIDNEPISPPKPMNIDNWSIPSTESKFYLIKCFVM
jgi:hypothetical protein